MSAGPERREDLLIVVGKVRKVLAKGVAVSFAGSRHVRPLCIVFRHENFFSRDGFLESRKKLAAMNPAPPVSGKAGTKVAGRISPKAALIAANCIKNNSLLPMRIREAKPDGANRLRWSAPPSVPSAKAVAVLLFVRRQL